MKNKKKIKINGVETTVIIPNSINAAEFPNEINTIEKEKSKKNEREVCANCYHEKQWHSYEKPHCCNKVISVDCFQDGHWEKGFCTCQKYKKLILHKEKTNK